ncbi:PspC domain-containing protein [Lysinibacillus sp. BPa_S21]|uniref:PspC domain-containing protein n=1 Tax=Lysinibacillus sp. BPa_S21 TaxID=2932478 RepID=UPI0035A99321
MLIYSILHHLFARFILRSRNDRIICVVCGGIAQSFGVSPWIIRLIFLFVIQKIILFHYNQPSDI